jgi:glycosyltransferase involved in cell wall biosynthesis
MIRLAGLPPRCSFSRVRRFSQMSRFATWRKELRQSDRTKIMAITLSLIAYWNYYSTVSEDNLPIELASHDALRPENPYERRRLMTPEEDNKSSWKPSIENAKKTILVINDNLPGNINGVVTFLSNIERLAVHDGYRMVYINPSFFPFVNCPGFPDVKLSLPINIASKIRDAKPDFIHIATEGPLGLASRLYCDTNNIPYNTAYHTRLPEYVQVVLGIPDIVGYSYLRWFHSNSRCLLTTTDAMVQELQTRGFHGRIQRMAFGVDRTIYSSKWRHDKDKMKKPGPVLLSVGRVSKEKGLDTFCALEYPGATKIVVGDGAYRRELEAKYPHVQFVGFQTGTKLAQYYANADCLVFTSVTDTFGLVMIESMACGTPVAAFPVTGPLDIVETGVTGYLSHDLKASIDACLALDRKVVEAASCCWSWDLCWKIFKENLIRADGTENL